MSYSVITYKNNFIRAYDLDLAIAILLILQRIETTELTEEKKEQIKHNWLETLQDNIACIDLSLDEIIQNRKDKLELIHLITELLSDLTQYKEILPNELLSPLLAKINVKMNDNYKLDLIYKTLSEIRHLIS